MLTITAANIVELSAYDYADREDITDRNKVLEKLELAFTFIYVVEAIIKIIALGLYTHKKSYLRSGWNICDLCIVIIG